MLYPLSGSLHFAAIHCVSCQAREVVRVQDGYHMAWTIVLDWISTPLAFNHAQINMAMRKWTAGVTFIRQKFPPQWINIIVMSTQTLIYDIQVAHKSLTWFLHPRYAQQMKIPSLLSLDPACAARLRRALIVCPLEIKGLQKARSLSNGTAGFLQKPNRKNLNPK